MLANGKPGRPKVVEPNFTKEEYNKVEKELQDYYKIKHIVDKNAQNRLQWIDSQLLTISSVDYSGMPKATGSKPENYKREELIGEKIVLESQIKSNEKLTIYFDNLLNTLSDKYKHILIETIAKPMSLRQHEYAFLLDIKMSRNTFKKHQKRAIGQYISASGMIDKLT